MNDVKWDDVTSDVIGASMLVLNELRPGLDEKLYENALVIELKERGHLIQQQLRFPVRFKSIEVGTLIPDLIVDRKVLVDTKVVAEFNSTHIAQMLGYLNITELDVAILVSFKTAKLKWKRIVS